MRVLHLLPLLALSSSATAEPSSPSTSSIAARQIPAAQINLYCITLESKAEYADFNATFEKVCHDLAGRELQAGKEITNETCFDEYCITTLLVPKCGSEALTSSIDYESCRTLFGLPWNNPQRTCKSGGYVGSPAPGACWTALSLATPKESDDRLPALPDKAWVPPGAASRKRQAPEGVTACAPGDGQYAVSYNDFMNDAASFCDDMVQSDITLSTGQSYSSDNRYCNDANCVDFLVNFYCVAPDGGPAHGNVTWNGCMQYFLHPWWGNDLVAGHGPCAESQGNLIKGGWITDVYPNACWNFSSLVLAPLSDLQTMPQAEDYVLVANEDPVLETSTEGTLISRQAHDAGLNCSQETFQDVFDAFCMLYEYCPYLNDQPFNLTQHFEVMGQDVALSVVHSGACLAGGKTGQDTCVKALEGALNSACNGASGDGGVQAGDCWAFTITA